MSRTLYTTPSSKPDARAAFKLARRWFIESRKLDMTDLAVELGVSRATLFRWVGNRDVLMAEILWSMAKQVFDGVAATAEETGGRRLAAIVGESVRIVTQAPFYRDYVRREPERALRLLTTNASPIQKRSVAYFENLLREEVDRGALPPPKLSLNDLAYVVIRISQGFMYTDMITGEPPDPDKAELAVLALLT